MIITKKSLARRTFLRGLGATLALPLLDSMIPALSARGATKAPRPPGVRLPPGRHDSGQVDARRPKARASSSRPP